MNLCGIGDEGASSLERQITLHQQLGLPGLELRTVDGQGIHELSEEQAHVAAEAVAAAGLVVPVVDTPLGSWSVNVGVDPDAEADVLRRAARNAALFGCHQLRIMSYPNDGRPESEWRAEAIRKVRMLVDLAEDLDVVLLHENCNGWAGASAARTMEMLVAVDSPRLKLLFDIGNGIAYGYDSLPFLYSILPWVEHVHVKDGNRVADEAVFGMPGEGQAELLACLQLLVDKRYQGWYSVEPHVALIPHLGVSDDPVRMESAYLDYVKRFQVLVDEVSR